MTWIESIALAVESLVNRIVGSQELNPFYHTGTISVFLLIVVAVTARIEANTPLKRTVLFAGFESSKKLPAMRTVAPESPSVGEKPVTTGGGFRTIKEAEAARVGDALPQARSLLRDQGVEELCYFQEGEIRRVEI